MKIIFLGTSYGVPSVGRHQQSILLETDNGNAYLIDCGAPVLDILVNRQYDLKKIKAIFLTHLHGDHINGIFDLLNLSKYFKMNYKVFMPEENLKGNFQQFCFQYMLKNSDENVTFEKIKSGKIYFDGALRVTAYKTDHMLNQKNLSYGFFVEADEKRIYITGDMHSSLNDFPKILYTEKTDMIISECAHFEPKEIFAKLSFCKCGKVAFIHVMPETRYAELMQLSKKVTYDVCFPFDNDEYTV